MTVIEIVDGDTIRVEFSNGDREDVRLLGVDTPEVHTQTNPSEWEGIPDSETGENHLRDWGHRASEFARTELEQGEQIRIVVDEQADKRGSYGRLLVYAYDDGELFNLKLLNQGYARFYDTEFSKRSSFADAEAAAQANDVGVWNFAAATPTPTATSTATPSENTDDLTIVEVHEDAEGNDHENENDEYLVFENTGDAGLDLSGWRVEDEKDHAYSFPSGFTLAPGDTVTLRTGTGTDTDAELYWGSDGAIWNNGGDTVYVYNDDGNLVLEESY